MESKKQIAECLNNHLLETQRLHNEFVEDHNLGVEHTETFYSNKLDKLFDSYSKAVEKLLSCDKDSKDIEFLKKQMLYKGREIERTYQQKKNKLNEYKLSAESEEKHFTLRMDYLLKVLADNVSTS